MSEKKEIKFINYRHMTDNEEQEFLKITRELKFFVELINEKIKKHTDHVYKKYMDFYYSKSSVWKYFSNKLTPNQVFRLSTNTQYSYFNGGCPDNINDRVHFYENPKGHLRFIKMLGVDTQSLIDLYKINNEFYKCLSVNPRIVIGDGLKLYNHYEFAEIPIELDDKIVELIINIRKLHAMCLKHIDTLQSIGEPV